MLSEEFNIEGHVVVVKKRLAEGGFGYIDLVTDSRTNAEYCLKRCGIQNTESQEIVNLEIKILRDFRCENIVQMIGSEMKVISSHRKEAFILLEYCSGGHLLDILNRKAGSYLKISVIGDVFSQVLKAVKALHDNNPTVTHRDLKLENILKARNGTIKLCDFGSCVFGNVPLTNALERSQAEDVIGKTTTQSYRAPEMVDLFMREELTEKTDIWALGCILYTLCFISHPFQDAGNLGILSAKVTMPEADSIPETARNLITMMLDMDPEARPNVDYLMSATTAITHGTALPSYSLSGEARRRKLEREQAATRRQVLMDKKSKKSTVPTRAPVQLDPNSAAARRLAAKRGGGQPTSSLRTTPPSSTNNLDFGNFGNFEKPAPVATSAQSTSDSTADSSQVFATNFDADFADVTPIQSATQTTASVNDMFFSDPGNDNDDGFGGGVTISAAVVSSDSANDMFFTESSPAEEDSSNHRNDGFSNFDDDDDDDRFPSTFTAPEVTVSSDSFFDNVATEEQHSPFKVDDGFGVSGTDYGFSNLTVNEDAKHSQSQDFFPTETSANNTQQDFLFGHDEDTTAKESRTDFDFFGTTEEHHNSHSQAASFQPPQNDPFDMFTEPPAPPSSSNGSHAAIDDIFSLSNEPNPTASKAANVMQMFNNVPSKNDDPFADVQPQHHQQRRGSGYNMSQQSGYSGYQQQQPSGYGGQPQRQHQNQQYGGGGVRQMNPPGGQRDPFGSLMGSLK